MNANKSKTKLNQPWSMNAILILEYVRLVSTNSLWLHNYYLVLANINYNLYIYIYYSLLSF